MCVILERQEAFIVYYTCGIAPYSNTLIILAVRQMSSNSVQVRFLPLNEFRSGQVLPPNKLGGGGGIDPKGLLRGKMVLTSYMTKRSSKDSKSQPDTRFQRQNLAHSSAQTAFSFPHNTLISEIVKFSHICQH